MKKNCEELDCFCFVWIFSACSVLQTLTLLDCTKNNLDLDSTKKRDTSHNCDFIDEDVPPETENLSLRLCFFQTLTSCVT